MLLALFRLRRPSESEVDERNVTISIACRRPGGGSRANRPGIHGHITIHLTPAPPRASAAEFGVITGGARGCSPTRLAAANRVPGEGGGIGKRLPRAPPRTRQLLWLLLGPFRPLGDVRPREILPRFRFVVEHKLHVLELGQLGYLSFASTTSLTSFFLCLT